MLVAGRILPELLAVSIKTASHRHRLGGGLCGARLAYDHDFGQFVLGAIATCDMGSIAVDNATLNNLSRVGLRAGFDWGANWFYTTGGAAWAA